MKLKNIESIEELKIGDMIYLKNFELQVVAKCEGAVMIFGQTWLTNDNIRIYQIEDKSEKWVPKDGEVIWGVTFDYEDVVFTANYYNTSEYHRLWLKRGIIFQTKEEAIACAKKMLEAIKK